MILTSCNLLLGVCVCVCVIFKEISNIVYNRSFSLRVPIHLMHLRI